MQLESRIEFQKRLEAEGRWKAAKIWMDNWRRDKAANSAGMSSRGLRELVWDEAEKVFPPIPVADQMAETWIPDDYVKKGHPDPLRDLLWVYEYFAVKSITAADAPNTGAWAMLCWARKNRDKFFDHLMSKGCTNTAQKKVKEVAEKRQGGSAKKTEPEDPGLKRLNRIFQRSGSSKKKKRPNGSEPNGGNGGGAPGTRVPVVREGSSGPRQKPEVAEEDQ
jgi:hypothetical protein